MRHFLSCLAAVLGLITLHSNDANAQERWPRWYMGLGASVTYLSEADVGGTFNGEQDFDTGMGATASLGYMPASTMPILNNMRLEAELGYRFAELDSNSLGGITRSANGNVSIFNYMGNAYYDFRNESQLTPYVGAGAGRAHVSVARNSGLGNTEKEDNAFAYQFMAGLSYAPKSVPLTEWVLGYRYLNVNEVSLARTGGGQVKLGDIQAHNVEVGGRFRF